MRIHTNYVYRFHLEVDREAQVLDCFWVDVLGCRVLVNQSTRRGVTLNQLWIEMLDTVKWCQNEYHKWGRWREFKLYAALDLQPFAIVTACEERREIVKHQVSLDMLCYESMFSRTQPPISVDPNDHMRRVRHLDDAWDGLQWLEMN
jgi:hypothetical protein